MEIELDDENIKQFVESSPLYVSRKFKNTNRRKERIFIKAIEATCSNCRCSRPFHYPYAIGGGSGRGREQLKTGITSLDFRCVTCGEVRNYFIHHLVENDIVTLTICGVFPREKIKRDKQLERFFKDDADSLEKALACLSGGYGIGAYAYLRRIIEGNIFALLDLLKEDIGNGAVSQDLINALDELKKESPMSSKIEVANRALPDYLKLNGLNPLGKLYGFLSEGIHALPDSECLVHANNAIECITYLVHELSDRKRRKEQFASKIGSLP